MGLRPARLRQVCNAVDVERFRPASADDRRSLRDRSGPPLDRALELFVGYFSRDKRPDLLDEAWSRMQARELTVGDRVYRYDPPDLSGSGRHARQPDQGTGTDCRRRRSPLLCEVDPGDRELFQGGRRLCAAVSTRGPVDCAPQAMASGLPCVATRLDGSTDGLIEHDDNGVLVEPDDAEVLRSPCGQFSPIRTGRLDSDTPRARPVLERYSIPTHRPFVAIRLP